MKRIHTGKRAEAKNIMKLHTILRVPKDKLFRPLDLPGNKGGPEWPEKRVSGSSECFHLKRTKYVPSSRERFRRGGKFV